LWDFHNCGLPSIQSTYLALLKSISTHYEDMKVNTKCGKWGGFGIVTGHKNHWK